MVLTRICQIYERNLFRTTVLFTSTCAGLGGWYGHHEYKTVDPKLSRNTGTAIGAGIGATCGYILGSSWPVTWPVPVLLGGVYVAMKPSTIRCTLPQ